MSGKDSFRSVRADAVAVGTRLPDPEGTVRNVTGTAVETDDYGTPMAVVAAFDNGTSVRIAFASKVRTAVAPGAEVPFTPGDVESSDPAEMGDTRPNRAASASSNGTASAGPGTGAAADLIPAQDGTPEAVVAHAAAVHRDDAHVQELAARLARGLNFKSGSNLQDVRDLALTLFVDLADTDNALTVTSLVTDQEFDGNFGRWKWIEGCLAIAAYITFEDGNIPASEEFALRLRSVDNVETDPLKAKVAATVRQRQLNEPHLYDREITRAAASENEAAEREWRTLRLGTLMYLRTHGGSQTLSAQELDRRINNELIAVRGMSFP